MRQIMPGCEIVRNPGGEYTASGLEVMNHFHRTRMKANQLPPSGPTLHNVVGPASAEVAISLVLYARGLE